MAADPLEIARAAGRAAAKDAPPLSSQQKEHLRVLLRSALAKTA